MLIEVTQADIDAGKKGDCYACPIVLAVRRALALPPDVEVSADDDLIQAGDDDGPVARSPYEARQFMKNFDFGFPVTPFAFEVPL